MRVTASQQGMRVWRNNVGALKDGQGNWIRFGLANDSKQMNETIKSADLIGCNPRVITHADLGAVIGQFVSLECKPVGWKYTGTAREQAQKRWADMINALGGDARFVSDPAQLL